MTFKIGDRVTPVNDDRVPRGSRGQVYIVRKVNPRNIRADAVNGTRGINFPAALLLPATEENIAAARDARPLPPAFEVGEVVTLKRPFRDIGVDVPMVVIGVRERVNVARLGGDAGRYVRVSPSGLQKITVHGPATMVVDGSLVLRLQKQEIEQ